RPIATADPAPSPTAARSTTPHLLDQLAVASNRGLAALGKVRQTSDGLYGVRRTTNPDQAPFDSSASLPSSSAAAGSCLHICSRDTSRSRAMTLMPEANSSS